MKEKSNNKGFVVSTVIYAILILLVIFMFTILLLYRNTYRNQKEFNEEVKEELNDYLIESNTTPECNFEIENVGTSKKLIVNVLTINQDNLQYAFTEEKVFQENNYTTITKAGTYKAYVKDEYGNEGNCSIVVDFTKPTCELSVSGESLKTLLVTKSSDTIGISFDNVNYGSATTKQITSAGTYTVYVKDSSNNIGSCSLTVDFTKPTCNLSVTNNSNGSKTITINSSDSDVLSNGYSFDGINFSQTKTMTKTYSDCASGTCTYKGYVKDSSNNVSSACTKEIAFDNEGPSVSLSVTGGKNTATIKATIADSGSGVKQYQITTSSAIPTSGWITLSTAKSSVIVDFTKTSANTYYVHAKDEIGNSNYSSKKIEFFKKQFLQLRRVRRGVC